MMATIPDISPETSFDVRVADFLDDRLQSAHDLDNLDDLIASVEEQRTQLQSQLDDAVKELDKARQKAEGGQGSLAARIDDFKKLQDSIDTRVQIAAASDAPNQAIARLQAPMKKVDAVDLAKKYLTLLRDVDNLRVETKARFAEDPKAALKPYAALKKLSSDLRSMEAGEGLHLVDHVESVTQHLWNEMRESLSAELEGVLNKRKWPKVDPSTEMDEEWIGAIEKLVHLQVAEVLYSPSIVSLLPFDVMAHIFVSEFRFHFLSDKRTSDPQLIGSHCFPWFISHVERWEDFFRDNLSHLLASEFFETPMASNAVYIDPVCAFITALLPVMREKVFDVVTKAQQSPSFLSSLIAQLMTFDETLRSRFGYDGGDPENGWAGLTSEVLDKYFDSWFQAEKTFAIERFQTIMEASDARNIDYDYAGEGKMKPTVSAVRVVDLLGSLTNQYNRVRKFQHKKKFLLGIQVRILDDYHELLLESLQKYQLTTSTLSRTLAGVSKEDMSALEGTGGLEKLCRVLGSSDLVVNTLKDWNTDDFFISLFDEMQTRAGRHNSGADENTGFGGARERAASIGGSKDSDGIFEETIEAYSNRRNEAQDYLVAALNAAHAKALRTYTSRSEWLTISDGNASDDVSQPMISPDLEKPMHILRRNFEFLKRTLSTASYRRVWRKALDKIQDQLWFDVISRHTFSKTGASQFGRDVAYITSLVDSFIPHGSVALDKLSEGVRLLTLPVDAGTSEEGAQTIMTLEEAYDRVFTDNDAARAALAELKMDGLTPQDARTVLQRRIENQA